jgi:hypothetical protein
LCEQSIFLGKSCSLLHDKTVGLLGLEGEKNCAAVLTFFLLFMMFSLFLPSPSPKIPKCYGRGGSKSLLCSPPLPVALDCYTYFPKVNSNFGKSKKKYGIETL